MMTAPSPPPPREKIWSLIRKARSAVLVTTAANGQLHARPMGCIQSQFDGRLWFLTFRQSNKTAEIAANGAVLVSYADPKSHEYVSVAGRARIVADRAKIKELWFEALRAWFPQGPDDSDLALIEVDAEAATYWTNAAGAPTYAWAYVRAKLTGRPLRSDEIVETDTLQL